MTKYLDQMRLKGKKAVITGGCGLIGRAAVDALAQAGAKVVIADVNERAAQTQVRLLSRKGYQVVFKKLDITDIDELKNNIASIVRNINGLDIWVNCAYPRTSDWGASPDKVTAESWRKNVDMQLNTYAMSSQYALEHMKKKGGSLINLGSIYGVTGGNMHIYEDTKVKPVPMIYTAVKGGIVNLGRFLASYYGPYNIRVNTVCPAGVYINHDPKFVRNYSRKVPLGRMAKPEEVASAILFLASPAASYITGTAFMVDGGWTAL